MNPAPGLESIEPVHAHPSEAPQLFGRHEPEEERFIELASNAVDYVKYKVKNGSENRFEDNLLRAVTGETTLRLSSQRALHNEMLSMACESPGRNQPPEVIDREDGICFSAKLAEKLGHGNCGEQAAVAFKWLLQYPIGGLLYVTLTEGNHSFVVLRAGPAARQNDVFRPDEAKKRFGPDAIICDPWLGGGSYFKVAKEWDERLIQMIKEAKPANPDAIRVNCLCRSTNKDRKTKEAEWLSRNAIRGFGYDW